MVYTRNRSSRFFAGFIPALAWLFAARAFGGQIDVNQCLQSGTCGSSASSQCQAQDSSTLRADTVNIDCSTAILQGTTLPGADPNDPSAPSNPAFYECQGKINDAIRASIQCYHAAQAELGNRFQQAITAGACGDPTQQSAAFGMADQTSKAASAIYSACFREHSSLCNGGWLAPPANQVMDLMDHAAAARKCGGNNKPQNDLGSTAQFYKGVVGPANAHLVDECYTNHNQASCAQMKSILQASQQQAAAMHATAGSPSGTPTGTGGAGGASISGQGGTSTIATGAPRPGDGASDSDSGDRSDTGRVSGGGSPSAKDTDSYAGIPGVPGDSDPRLRQQIDACIQRKWGAMDCGCYGECRNVVSRATDRTSSDLLDVDHFIYQDSDSSRPSESTVSEALRQADLIRARFEDEARAKLVSQLGTIFGRFTGGYDFPPEVARKCRNNLPAIQALASFHGPVPDDQVFHITDAQVLAAIQGAQEATQVIRRMCMGNVCEVLGDPGRGAHIASGFLDGLAAAEDWVGQKAQSGMSNPFAAPLLAPVALGMRLNAKIVGAPGAIVKNIDEKNMTALANALDRQAFLSAGYNSDLVSQNTYSGLNPGSFPVVKAIMDALGDASVRDKTEAVRKILEDVGRKKASADIGTAMGFACDPQQLPWYQLIGMGDDLFKDQLQDPKVRAVFECYQLWYANFTKDKQIANAAITVGCVFAPFIPGAGVVAAAGCAGLFAAMSVPDLDDAHRAAQMAAAAAPASTQGGPISNKQMLQSQAEQQTQVNNAAVNIVFAAQEGVGLLKEMRAFESTASLLGKAESAGASADRAAQANRLQNDLNDMHQHPEKYGLTPNQAEDIMNNAFGRDGKLNVGKVQGMLADAQARNLAEWAPITPQDAKAIVKKLGEAPPSSPSAYRDGANLINDASRKAVGDIARKYGITDPSFINDNAVPGRNLKQVEAAAQERAVNDYASAHGTSPTELQGIATPSRLTPGQLLGIKGSLGPEARSILDGAVARQPAPPHGQPDLREFKLLSERAGAMRNSREWGGRLWDAIHSDNPDALKSISKRLVDEGASKSTASRIADLLGSAKNLSLDTIASLFEKYMGRGACGVGGH